MIDYYHKKIKGESGALTLLVSVLMFLVLTNPFEKPTASIILALLIISTPLIPYIAWRNNPNRHKVILGIFFYGFFHIIGYGFMGFIGHEVAPIITMADITDESEYIALSLVLIHLLIVFSITLICQILFKKQTLSNDESKRQPEFNITNYRVSIIVCIILTSFEFFIAWKIPPFTMFDGIILGVVRFFSYMYLFYFLFYLNYGNWLIRILAIIGCLIGQGLILSASVGPFAEVGLTLILIYMQKGKIPVLPVSILLIMFIVYQPMKGAVRFMQDKGGYGLVESFTAGVDSIEGDDYLTLIDIASKRTDYNLLLSSFVQNIGVVNEDDYLGVDGYKNLLYVLIPRVLWPNKPQDNFANEWAVQEGYLQKVDFNTSFNLPWIAQMYLSFGSIGIILGGVLVGFIFFLLERYYWTIQLNPWSFAMGYSVMRPILVLEADFAVTFGIVIKIIMLDILFRLIKELIKKLNTREEINNH